MEKNHTKKIIVYQVQETCKSIITAFKNFRKPFKNFNILRCQAMLNYCSSKKVRIL